VDLSRYGTNTPYLIDFIPICLSPKLASSTIIRSLYLEKGLSAAQIASQLRLSKTFVLARLRSFGIKQDDAQPKRYTDPDNYRCPVCPFGYSVKDGKLIPNKTELRVCHAIVESIDRQGQTYRATAKELARRGMKNRAGRTSWSHGSVKAIYNRWKGKI
jgi:hypothetical protein